MAHGHTPAQDRFKPTRVLEIRMFSKAMVFFMSVHDIERFYHDSKKHSSPHDMMPPSITSMLAPL
jgi:hypothetical protein